MLSFGYVQRAMRQNGAISCDPVLGVLASNKRTVIGELRRASRNPFMKFFGRRAFGSSSARKYFRICGNCFQ